MGWRKGHRRIRAFERIKQRKRKRGEFEGILQAAEQIILIHKREYSFVHSLIKGNVVENLPGSEKANRGFAVVCKFPPVERNGQGGDDRPYHCLDFLRSAGTLERMQFNPELMRAILLRIEAVPAGEVFNGPFTLDGYQWREVHAHAQILVEDGWFTDSRFNRGSDTFPSVFLIRDLSMKGHDYLANIRNDTVWKKLLAKAKADGVSTSTTVLTALAAALAKKYAGLE